MLRPKSIAFFGFAAFVIVLLAFSSVVRASERAPAAITALAVPSRVFSGHHGMFSPDGKYILDVSQDGKAILWDVQSGEQIRTFGDSGSVDRVTFSPNGN